MSKGKLPKVLVIGHTKGIGKAIYDYYEHKGYKVKGLSRSNGYHLVDLYKFEKYIWAYDWIILNAFYYLNLAFFAPPDSSSSLSSSSLLSLTMS